MQASFSIASLAAPIALMGLFCADATADVRLNPDGLGNAPVIDFEDAAPGIQTGQEWRAATGISFEAVLFYSSDFGSVPAVEGTYLAGEAGASPVAIGFDAPQTGFAMTWGTNPGTSRVSVFLGGTLVEEVSLATTTIAPQNAFLVVENTTFDRLVISITPDVAVVNSFVIDNVQVDAGAALGTPFCVASPNSVSVQGAELSASGSTRLDDADFTLRATRVPDGAGLFFYGPSQTQSPLGNGMLCVSGALVRTPVVASTGGEMTLAMDFDAFGTDMASLGTVNFQAWYRDPSAGGAASNLTGGLEVVFQP